MRHIPVKLSVLFQELTKQLPVLLGKNLAGIYLHGSVTQRSFNPKRSDVDVIVVTNRDVSGAQFTRLSGWLNHAAGRNPWTARLQMLFLIKTEVLTMNSSACLYQFGQLKRSGSDGNPIIWLDMLKSGVVLFGPQPDSFVPEITREILFDALKRELGYLREEIIEKPQSEWRDLPTYRAYVVLTLCRILYSFEKAAIVSKPAAAKWAIKKLPKEWHQVIQQALDSDDDNCPPDIPLVRIAEFIAFAESKVHAV
jgi:predicted nucleotidyltransferase